MVSVKNIILGVIIGSLLLTCVPLVKAAKDISHRYDAVAVVKK